MSALTLIESLAKHESLLHELQFRDKVKSAEFHFATSFDFDGFFENELLEILFSKIKEVLGQVEFSTFGLGVSWPQAMDDAEKSHLKFILQTELIKKIESELSKRLGDSLPDVYFLIDFKKKLVLIKIRPVYVVGNYCKYSREIAQTEYFCNKCRGAGCWYCNNTGHFSGESVEQLITKSFVNHFGAKLLIMHGAGREDLDVLMLGKGRPFVAELVMPKKRIADLKEIELEINSECKGKVSINSLEFCDLSKVSAVKDAFHDKIYTAFIVCKDKFDLNNLSLNKEINVLQYTPSRVEKRRAKLKREKKVTLLNVVRISDNELVLTLKTSHGTYVKEFISSDHNKTNPSISSMLKTNCTCALLDVEEICE
ncbi:MAG: tRNA pseudouridine(54/55) synthase Pus10 [archaeon]